jgi:hypothetical protein
MALKKYERGQTIHDRAAHIWQILVPWVTWGMTDGMRPGLITYGRLAQELGYSPQAGRTLSKSLGSLANLCEREAIPALNAVVVRRDTEQAGDGLWTAIYEHSEDEVEAVLQHVWRSYKAPTPRQFRTAWEETLAEQI